jgi:hypothetical protein
MFGAIVTRALFVLVAVLVLAAGLLVDLSPAYAAGGALDWRELVPGQGEALLWLVQALLVVGLVRLAGEALAGLAGLVPGVGPVLAAALRLFAGSYERWLAQKVPALADVAVQRSEEALKGAGGPAKLGAAVAQLQRSAPGLSPGQARAQVEAALTRLRGAGLEQKSGGK